MSLRENLRRNPVLWLVIGLPLLSIIAGISLLIVATRVGGHDISPDEVRRTARLQETDLGPDYAAMQMGLSAILREQDGALYLNPVSGNFPRVPLVLELRHPIEAVQDERLQLQPQDDGQWRADAVLDSSHDWNVVLAPASGAWRLHGRLPRDQHAVRLAHAFDRNPDEPLDAVRGHRPPVDGTP